MKLRAELMDLTEVARLYLQKKVVTINFYTLPPNTPQLHLDLKASRPSSDTKTFRNVFLLSIVHNHEKKATEGFPK